MGCFLTCFGLSKNRKRRKPSNRNTSRDQRHGSYQPLDSDLYPNQETTTEKKPNRSKSKSSEAKEKSSIKIIKKVTFNLNVKTYEPLPNVDFTSYFSESDDDKCEEEEEEKSSAYPANYRYHNCIEEEEEDDLAIGESSDTEEGDDEEYDSDYEENDTKTTEELFSRELRSAKLEKRYSSLPAGASLDQELKKIGMNSKATRDRSQYVFSVLNPVENLTQWKAVKAKSRKPSNKENIPCPKQTKPLLQDDAVNASLSNWLVLSKAGPNTTV